MNKMDFLGSRMKYTMWLLSNTNFKYRCQAHPSCDIDSFPIRTHKISLLTTKIKYLMHAPHAQLIHIFKVSFEFIHHIHIRC
jgi:hypothetical protein